MVPVYSKLDLLPDSRLQDRSKGVVRGDFLGNSINWAPVFCANCAKPYGYVPEENMKFAFWLCNDCVDKWGPIAGTMTISEKVFWQTVHDEQLEKHGRLLTEKELIEASESSTTALGKLLREGS